MKVRQIHVFLARDEWTSPVMERVATRYLNDPQYAGETPLVVRVNEHGGWTLSYALIDGKVETIGSANSDSIFPEHIQKFRESIYHAEWEHGQTIRRDNQQKHFHEIPEKGRFDWDGFIFVKSLDDEGCKSETGDKTVYFSNDALVIPL
jgi:hypothetical protein